MSIAVITKSDEAPDEAITFGGFASAPTVSFKLDGRTKKYETDDAGLIRDAQYNSWLNVEIQDAAALSDAFIEGEETVTDGLTTLPVEHAEGLTVDAETVEAAEADDSKTSSKKKQD